METYAAAALLHSQSVQELRRQIRTAQREEYKRLEEISFDALVKAEQAKLALQEHVTAHHC